MNKNMDNFFRCLKHKNQINNKQFRNKIYKKKYNFFYLMNKKKKILVLG